MKRREFIKASAVLAATAGITGEVMASTNTTPSNPLPEWKGFNLLDFFAPDPAKAYKFTPEEYFKWMRDWGFNFVRFPLAYPFYLDIDHSKNITPDDVYKISSKRTDQIEQLVYQAQKHGLHTCINIHRAPGFCINAGFNEPYNLWKDEAAQKAFVYHWKLWATKFKSVAADKVSFDLLNEPCVREDMNDQHSSQSKVPGDLYKKVATLAVDAIREVSPKAIIIADGNNVGNDVTPELVDLKIAQSCRGYFPGIISHYKAPWAMKDISNLPELKWPGRVGGQELNREMLETFYKPWIELANAGTGVHCGECGCYNKTPHAIFLAWFGDVLDIFHQNKIGFALWEFDGEFGILNSKREDVAYEDWNGHKLDRKLLSLLQKNM